MKYILEIEEDLFAELKDIAMRSNTDTDTLVTAILKRILFRRMFFMDLFRNQPNNCSNDFDKLGRTR